MDPKSIDNHSDPANAESLIQTYIRAKDENRPHLMPHAFAQDATLTMTVKSDAIAFPGRSEGVQAISDVLARRFGQAYDNVYTFCVTDAAPAQDARSFACDWLVGMTDKASGNVRVGCGSYTWQFTDAGQGLRVQELDITIEVMQVLDPRHTHAVLDAWLARLPYPWTDSAHVLAQAPSLQALTPVLDYVGR